MVTFFRITCTKVALSSLVLLFAFPSFTEQKAAVCITGTLRTFMLDEVHTKLFEAIVRPFDVDVFLYLTITADSQNNIGCVEHLHNFPRMLAMVKPTQVVLAKSSVCEQLPLQTRMPCCPDKRSSSLQLAWIDSCFQAAHVYASRRSFSYSHYVRVRPDLLIGGYLPQSAWTSPVVITSIKADAPGSDMFFMFQSNLLESWWNKLDFRCNSLPGCCPEYYIFRNVAVQQVAELRVVLVRTPQKYYCWDHGHICNASQVQQLRERMPHDSACVKEFNHSTMYDQLLAYVHTYSTDRSSRLEVSL